MPEFRFEPLTRRWIIAGGDRDTRPNDYHDSIEKRSNLSCPFCAGNEALTPTAVQEFHTDKGEHWSVRVVPNKYPAVNGAAPYTFAPRAPSATFELQPGRGVHEVIIESPRHVVDLTDLNRQELIHSFHAYRDRLRAAAEVGLAYAQVFKNVGSAAGASLEHSHSQLIGLPWLPAQLEEQLASCREHYQEHDCSLLTTLLLAEKKFGRRVIGRAGDLLAWCPFASRFGYECWIAPSKQQADFRKVSDKQLAELALFTEDLVRRIKTASGLSAYNLVLHTQPFQAGDFRHFHWYWQILPRGSKQAGFEWATGHFVNPCLPEAAADAINAVPAKS